MPRKAPTICSCGKTTPSGAVCPCRGVRKAEHDARRPSSAARGYDHAFRKATKGFLDSRPTCACGAKATAVGHITSIRSRPDLRLVPSNWKPICRACNRREAHVEAKATPKTGGWSPTSSQKGRDRQGSTARTSADFSFSGGFR